MRAAAIVSAVIVVALGAVVAWIGLDLSADFADLGSAAVRAGDDGSIPAFVLIPAGLVLVAAGTVLLVSSIRIPTRR